MTSPPFPYPLADVGSAPADVSGLLRWVARRQWRTLVLGMAFGVPWMLSSALLPAAIGGAIDHGLVARDGRALALWSGACVLLGLSSALFTCLRHWTAVRNWLLASFRAGLVAEHGVRRAGPALTREVSAGEVATVFASDFGRFGGVFDVTARFSGAVASLVVVAVLLLRTSLVLGLIVLVGAPTLIAALSLLFRPLQRRQAARREELGALTSLGTDTISGLRVLRGIGGEAEFRSRYAAQSARVRAAGVRLAALQALLDALQTLLPGLFVLLVTGVGAHLALRGEITPGQLVAFFGYTMFLTMPLRTAVEFVERYTAARVVAARIVAILAVRPDHADERSAPGAGTPSPLPVTDPAAVLLDPVSGARITPGHLTAVVSADPQDSADLLARLARVGPDAVGTTWGEVALDAVPLDVLREAVVLQQAHPRVFTGSVREVLRAGRPRSDETLLAALDAASGADILDALDAGLDSHLAEAGRTLSGGQRQRLILARALVLDPAVLLLVEPTSAVDAHTEARVAARLAAARAGRTTVVTTVSPILLDAADDVVFLDGGRATDTGGHHELLRRNAAYRDIVLRGED